MNAQGKDPRQRGKRLRVLAITKLFPNAAEPLAAPFNRQQFAELARICELHVFATLPWFPGAQLAARWSRAGRTVDVPVTEEIAGLFVRHPRVLYVPKIGHVAAPALYAASLLPRISAFRGRVDVVLASWAYPDAVAGIFLARLLGVPAVVKVHGSDIDVLADTWWGAATLRRALPRAARIVAVSRPLGEKVVGFGVRPDRVVLVPNGVDREVFRVQDRAAARERLGLGTRLDGGRDDARWIVFVGRLDREKGIYDLLDAFGTVAERDPSARLALVGSGPELEACRARAAAFGDRVLVAGPRPLPQVADFMAAADVVTLPSWHEGTPNVLLEALACGRRIVATRVGGIPDVVHADSLGELVEVRDAPALADALGRALRTPYDPATISAAAPGDWAESARQLHDVLLAATGVRLPAFSPPADAVRLGA